MYFRNSKQDHQNEILYLLYNLTCKQHLLVKINFLCFFLFPSKVKKKEGKRQKPTVDIYVILGQVNCKVSILLLRVSPYLSFTLNTMCPPLSPDHGNIEINNTDKPPLFTCLFIGNNKATVYMVNGIRTIYIYVPGFLYENWCCSFNLVILFRNKN